MPELPEVETIRHDLRLKVLNKKIKDVKIFRHSTVRSDELQFVDLLKLNRFKDLDRIGKLLVFNLTDKKHFLLCHLKMTGQLIYKWDHKVVAGGHSDAPLIELDVPNNHTRVTVIFSDNSELHFNDMRAFGYMKIVDSEGLKKSRARFGLEPLTPEFTLEEFKRRLLGRKTSIKALLLNQQMFAGIGNIYADEACFAAGVRPDRRAYKLTSLQVGKLYAAINKVIAKAIKERGTTFNNYIDPHGRKGNFLKFLKVYHRGGQPCKKCKTTLKKLRVAGRGTVFCVKCQK